MTRINDKFTRVYMDGVDVSGYARTVGSLGWDYEFQPDRAFTDQCLNVIAGRADITAGGFSSFLDNDTAGVFALAKSVATRNYMVTYGTNAVAVAGDPMFAWQFEQANYKAEGGNGFVAVGADLSNASYASTLTYSKPWGFVLHAKGIETAVNTAVGLDDLGAASALGGIFVYQLFSSNGTITLKAQDAATNTNPSFSDLSGATSGSIDASVTPKSGMVALGTTAAVRRYMRWQIVLGTATTATFALGFIRA